MSPILFLALMLSAAPAPSARAPRPAPRREFLRRVIQVTDATREVPVTVSAGNATTLAFPQPINGARVVLADAHGYFGGHPVDLNGNFLMLKPAKDIPAGEAVAMQVTLVDGTGLPPILLSSAPGSTDLFVDIDIAFKTKASADSAIGLKAQLGELQARLDECQQSAGDKGAMKVAELVLRQDFTKPAAFVVEKHSARHLDKQSQLLVETHDVYRLFDTSFLVVSLENRDPDKLWVLERAEVSVAGGGSSVGARVLDVAQEMNQGVPPGEEAKLVVAFKTPEQTAKHSFELKLFEKAGNRHVTLSDLKL